MAREFGNRIAVLTTTTGLGSVTLGQVLSNAFQTFAEAGITDGAELTYLITEGNDFEVGVGTYNSSGPTLDRDTVVRSKIGGTAGTTKMTLAGNATVRLDVLASDIQKLAYLTVTQDVDLDAIETRVNQLDAAIVLQGTWDASSGSFPGSGTAQAGDSWIVSTGGTVDGVAFAADDRIIAIADNASTSTYASNWHKADYTDLVASVAGKTGAVTLVKADITDLGNATSSAAGLMEAATATEFRSDNQDEYKALTPRYVWDAADEEFLTDASTIAVDFSSGINFTVTLGANRTMGNPTNVKVGQTGYIRVVQDGTGSRTLSWSSNWEFAAKTAPTLTTAASSEDLLPYIAISATRILVAAALDIG